MFLRTFCPVSLDVKDEILARGNNANTKEKNQIFFL
jgi:hypothetical protein